MRWSMRSSARCADGDIGVHFPPSDPQWRGASSDRFFEFAVQRLEARGGRIAHLDVTVVCEAPRVGPHRDEDARAHRRDRRRRADRVGVKATTSEQMGFTGRGEGIAPSPTPPSGCRGAKLDVIRRASTRAAEPA